jgi:hypothetical protein
MSRGADLFKPDTSQLASPASARLYGLAPSATHAGRAGICAGAPVVTTRASSMRCSRSDLLLELGDPLLVLGQQTRLFATAVPFQSRQPRGHTIPFVARRPRATSSAIRRPSAPHGRAWSLMYRTCRFSRRCAAQQLDHLVGKGCVVSPTRPLTSPSALARQRRASASAASAAVTVPRPAILPQQM